MPTCPKCNAVVHRTVNSLGEPVLLADTGQGYVLDTTPRGDMYARLVPTFTEHACFSLTQPVTDRATADRSRLAA